MPTDCTIHSSIVLQYWTAIETLLYLPYVQSTCTGHTKIINLHIRLPTPLTQSIPKTFIDKEV